MVNLKTCCKEEVVRDSRRVGRRFTCTGKRRERQLMNTTTNGVEERLGALCCWKVAASERERRVEVVQTAELKSVAVWSWNGRDR